MTDDERLKNTIVISAVQLHCCIHTMYLFRKTDEGKHISIKKSNDEIHKEKGNCREEGVEGVGVGVVVRTL